MVQTCIVHLLRHSLDFVSYKDRKAVAAALKGVYRAVDAAAGEACNGWKENGREVSSVMARVASIQWREGSA
jgi:transposase-like protein